MTLNLVLVESALQLVPAEIQTHTQIRQYARRRQKSAGEVLLDRAFHHAAMQKLIRTRYPIPADKMGRPDIVHNTLLQILETPLNWEGHLRVFVHTQDDHVISISPIVRLPKNYIRFVGLIEQLFQENQVPKKGAPLLRIEKMPLQSLVKRIEPSRVVGFSTLGSPTLMRKAAMSAGKLREPLVFVGAFPRGHFTGETRQLMDDMFSVDRRSLDAWIVAGRFVYDFESAIGLAEKRIKPT
jgi:rRNA small subunit pseudouridine methyltransferase Nep1